MTQERDSLEDKKRWDSFWNNPDLSKREAFRLWNTKPNCLTKQQRLLIKELFSQ